MTAHCLVCQIAFEKAGSKNTCGDECRRQRKDMLRRESNRRYEAKPEAKAKRRARDATRDAAKAALKPPPKCVICLAEFKGRGPKKTCGEQCSRILDARTMLVYQRQYRRAMRQFPELRKRRQEQYRANSKRKKEAAKQEQAATA